MDIKPALNFASSQLAPRAATKPEFLEEFELTMTLLIFLPSDDLQPRLAELLKPALRRQVASKVNEAILTSMGARGEARIRGLHRLRLWAENKSREAGKDLPYSLPIGLQEFGTAESQNGNGEVADVMVQ